MCCFNRTYALQTYEKSNFSRHKKEQPSKTLLIIYQRQLAEYDLAKKFSYGDWKTTFILSEKLRINSQYMVYFIYKTLFETLFMPFVARMR